ncbi:Uncharacterised protein [Turicibacter sanguinis]|nr:Uncharacterised protein [Turicibacter sanguinis]
MINLREVETKLEDEALFKQNSLPIAQAVEISGLSRDQLRHRLTEGEDFRVIDQLTYFKKDALERLIKERETFKEFLENSLPTAQATKFSGFNRDQLRRRLTEGEDYMVIDYIAYFKKDALERLIEERDKAREPFKEFIENSVTMAQAVKTSGISQGSLYRYLKEGQERMTIGRTCYVSKQALVRVMKERDITPITEVSIERTEVPDGYSLVTEICRKNNLNYNLIRDRLERDLRDYCVRVRRRMYLKDDIIPNLIKEYQFAENAYKRKDLENLLNISATRLQKVIDIIKEDVEWKKLRTGDHFDKAMVDQKVEEFGGGYQYYQNCQSRLIKAKAISRGMVAVPNSVKIAPETIEVDNEPFIKVDSVQNFYNLVSNGVTMNSTILRNAIKRGSITDVYKNEYGALYVSKKELDAIKSILDHSISLMELSKESLLIQTKSAEKIQTKSAEKKLSVLSYIDGSEIFNFTIFGTKHKRVRIQNPEQFKVDFAKRVKEDMAFRNTKNPHDRYELLERKLTKEQKKQFPFLIRTYKEFVFCKLNNSTANSIVYLTSELFNALSRFINLLSKDMQLLTDDEILQILSTDGLTDGDRENIALYLNYLRRGYSDECLFKNQYNRYREVKGTAADAIYTLEEWVNYSNFLTDIDRHIEKSFERYAYAKRWLYAILHFSVAWRSGDFLETPGLDFLDSGSNPDFDNLDINRYTLDWFKNNDFKLSDGQIIINAVKRFVEDRETQKTGALKHFIIPTHYVIPVSIAFIIAEQHRRASNSSTLFSVKVMDTRSIRNTLGEEMAGFSSRKANRSLLSYIYDEATESEKYNSIAYSMASYMRSHKPNRYQIAQTTSHYIYALNKDGDIHTISRQLFRRGVFGWLYKVMIDLAYSDDPIYSEQYQSLSQMTNDIETIQKDLSASGIENISRFMSYELKSRRNVFNELFQAPKDQVKELIHQLILGNLSSKEKNIYCVKPKKCPFPTQSSCKGCRYSIPTNYSLLAISDELLGLCEKLSLVDINDTVSRAKYSHQITRLMMVLREAKTEFDKFDPDYFKTFVPLKKLGNRIAEVTPKMYNI